jgi:hypothetical protein
MQLVHCQTPLNSSAVWLGSCALERYSRASSVPPVAILGTNIHAGNQGIEKFAHPRITHLLGSLEIWVLATAAPALTPDLRAH